MESKKWVAQTLTLSLCALFSLLVWAGTGHAVGVEIGTATGAPGGTVEIPVTLTHVPTDAQSGIVAMQFVLNYDATVVRAPMRAEGNNVITECAALMPLTKNWLMEQNALLNTPGDIDDQMGVLKIPMAWRTPLTGDGIVLTLTFHLVGAVDECSPITVNEVRLFPETGEKDEYLANPIVDGEICIGTTGSCTLELKGGWNLISLPGTPDNPDPASLVGPGSQIILPLFEWDPTQFSYVPVTKLEACKGYWILTVNPAGETVEVPCTPIDTCEIALAQGWNLIGTIIDEVDFSNPQDDPDGSVLLPAFGWNPETSAYVAAPPDLLQPGKGYWVLSPFQPSTLRLGPPPQPTSASGVSTLSPSQ